MEEINKLKKEISTLQGTIDAYKMSENEANEIIAELTAENKLKKQVLQEIKEYAESIGNEEMINGYALRAKSALWRIANMITKAESEE